MPIHNSIQMQIVNLNQSKKFIDEFNKNKISEELLSSCHKAGKLFSSDKLSNLSPLSLKNSSPTKTTLK